MQLQERTRVALVLQQRSSRAGSSQYQFGTSAVPEFVLVRSRVATSRSEVPDDPRFRASRYSCSQESAKVRLHSADLGSFGPRQGSAQRSQGRPRRSAAACSPRPPRPRRPRRRAPSPPRRRPRTRPLPWTSSRATATWRCRRGEAHARARASSHIFASARGVLPPPVPFEGPGRFLPEVRWSIGRRWSANPLRPLPYLAFATSWHLGTLGGE